VVVALNPAASPTSATQAFCYVRAVAPGPLAALALIGFPVWMTYGAVTLSPASLASWFVAVTCGALSALAFWLPLCERKNPMTLVVGEPDVTLPKTRVRGTLDSVTCTSIRSVGERGFAGSKRLLTVVTPTVTYRLVDGSFKSPQHDLSFIDLLRQRTGIAQPGITSPTTPNPP
jgi:hypothetical protein